MTAQEFEKITADIKHAASEAEVDLADPTNPYTVWMENPTGSGSCFLRAKSTSLQNAQAKAGPLHSVIYGVQGEKIQVVLWRDNQWIDAYSR